MARASFTPRALAGVALMAALTAVGAFLRIPLPYVPITLQVAFVCLAGLWLGPRLGALSQGVYLLVGLAGFPVFASGGGLHYLLDPTFGYLLGFPLAAWTVGHLTSSVISYCRCLLAIQAGLALVYLLGIAWLYLDLRFLLGQQISLATAAQIGLVPVPKDLALSFLLAFVGRQVRRRLEVISFRRCSGT